MMMDNEVSDLLKGLIQINGRIAFPEEKLMEIIGATVRLQKAYNLCDGTRAQGDIVKELKLDKGNFSKTVKKWVSSGIILKLGQGNDTKLLHIYPLSE